MPRLTHLALPMLLGIAFTAHATEPESAPTSQSALTPQQRWESIAPFFAPPPKFAGKLADVPSVMKFDDGTPLTKFEDWPKRRREIRAYWDAKLGAWPALLEKPSVEYLAQQHIENFTRHKIRIQLATEAKRDAYLFVPDGEGKFPAVVCVFYTAEMTANLDPKNTASIFGPDLAKRGFVTLCLGDPGYDARTRMQPLMYLAYVAANAHTALAQMPQVDPDRIGIIGHSFGGKWSMFASCLYDKFAAAVWSDGGITFNEADANSNYWESWYLGYEKDKGKNGQRKPGVVTEADPRTGPYKDLVVEHHDLNELHALMAPRPFLVSGGADDPLDKWPVVNTDIALYKFLGFENRIALTHRDGHRPTPEAREQAYRFFEHFLKDKPPATQHF